MDLLFFWIDRTLYSSITINSRTMEIESVVIDTSPPKRCRPRRTVYVVLLVTLLFAIICTILQYPAVLPVGTIFHLFALQNQGRTLSAVHFHPSTATAKSPAPAVLFFHGSFTSKEWMTPLLTASALNGFHAFAIDQASHGRSTGSLYDRNDTLGSDATALAHYASSFPSVNSSSLHLAGWSLGGFACMQAVLNKSRDIGFRSTILIGMSPCFGHGSNITSQTRINLLVVSGKNDEIFPSQQLLDDVASIQGVPMVQEGILYGNLQNGTGRKIIITGTDHMFEPSDNGGEHAVIEWVRAASEWSNVPVIFGSPEAYEFFSIFTGLLWVGVVVISMALENVPQKSKSPGNGKKRTKGCACDACCAWCTSRVPLVFHGAISFFALLVGGVVNILPSLGNVDLLNLLLGWAFGMALFYAIQYRALLGEYAVVEQPTEATDSPAVATPVAAGSVMRNCCCCYCFEKTKDLVKNQMNDAFFPIVTFVGVFFTLQIWLSFTPFDLGMGPPLFCPLFGPAGSAIYRRFLLFLLLWLCVSSYILYDISCLRITIPLILPQEKKHTVGRVASVICRRFVGRGWFYMFILIVLFVPLIFADLRPFGDGGVLVLIMVPLSGFSMMTTVIDVVGEMLGRAPLGVAIVMAGIMSNLFACSLQFV